jgi:signal transduction histidine kinase
MMSSVANIAQDVYAEAGMRRRFQELIERDGEVRDLEYQVRRHDGTTLWICENARVARNGSGDVLYYEGTIQDISRRKKAEAEAAKFEQQLLQSKKMEAIGTLASGIAHDFNNLLAAIIGYTELALAKLPQEASASDDLRDSLGASLRAREIVGQILLFGRRGAPERHPIRVSAIVREVKNLVRVSLPARICLKEEIAAADDGAVANAAQLHQVLLNLTTNAVHAIGEDEGRVLIRLDQADVGSPEAPAFGQLRAGPHLKLTVSDTGRGIPPEFLEHIFEPFFTTKPIGQGTGLGLSVVHGIVKAHGGEILVESTPGAGSAFAVYLPRSK